MPWSLHLGDCPAEPEPFPPFRGLNGGAPQPHSQSQHARVTRPRESQGPSPTCACLHSICAPLWHTWPLRRTFRKNKPQAWPSQVAACAQASSPAWSPRSAPSLSAVRGASMPSLSGALGLPGGCGHTLQVASPCVRAVTSERPTAQGSRSRWAITLHFYFYFF